MYVLKNHKSIIAPKRLQISLALITFVPLVVLHTSCRSSLLGFSATITATINMMRPQERNVNGVFGEVVVVGRRGVTWKI